MKDRIIITVDGLAGSGKTTLADLLAKKLGFIAFSSGALYRAVAYIALSEKADLEDADSVTQALSKHTLRLHKDNENAQHVSIDGKIVDSELRDPLVSEATSKVSRHASVRAQLTKLQQEVFQGFNIVAEGRDMGTVIFPESPLKFFVQVSEEVRIQRRLGQLIKGKEGLSQHERNQLKEQMKIEVSERDKRDSTRLVAPTLPAPDAIIIDNSARPLTEIVENMYDFALKRGLV